MGIPDRDLWDDSLMRDPEPPTPKYRAKDFPKKNLADSNQFRLSVRHISQVHDAATPDELRQGRLWYPKVHEAVAKGVKGTSMTHLQGAGLVAAVSPNMDFDRANIHAFSELHGLKQHQWDAIVHSATATKSGPYHKRTPEAADALKGLSISRATDSGLFKAHRLMQGEDVDDVMPRRTAPKTNAFAHNIHDPSDSSRVTIDGRAHDIVQNEMWPWEYTGRGIRNADLKSATKLKKDGTPAASFGKRSRYEHFEDAYKTAAAHVGEESPSAMQAITWVTGKRIERPALSNGQARKVGQPRKRQPYIP